MRICVVGAFGFDDLANATGGQPVKTRELYYGLTTKYGQAQTSFVETYRWQHKPIKMLWQLIRNVPRSDVVIMLPAHNGLKVFSRLLQIVKKKKAKLFYDVIGGWLPTMVKEKPEMLPFLQKMDGIWVETTSMQRSLQELGLQQVTVIPNFKSLQSLKPSELTDPAIAPCRLATFSRVMEEKGITDAVETIHRVNTQLGRKAFSLDIYGPVAPQYAETFENLQAQYGDFVTYKGVAKPEESVQILKDYYALLFPTKYYTEGIPGTIIDAYAAGVPVITARWLNHGDIFEEGVTGLGYPFGDTGALEQLLLELAAQPDRLTALKPACLKKAEQYMPETAMERIATLIGV